MCMWCNILLKIRRLRCFLFGFLILSLCSKSNAQTSKADSSTLHRFFFYDGCIAFSNTRVIPNGLPGKANGIAYTFEKQSLTKARTFIFNIQYNFGRLHNNFMSDKAAAYTLKEINMGGSWLWPVKTGNNRFFVKAGGGIFGHAEYFNPGKMTEVLFVSANPVGNWNLSVNGAINLAYKWDKLQIRNNLNVPILVGGFFPEYQYFPTPINREPVSYITVPNVFAYFGNFRKVDYTFTLDFIAGKLRYSIGYQLMYNSFIINGNTQKYTQNMVGLGIGL